MKSKIPSVIFRILTILTFLCGAVMFVNFVRSMVFSVNHDADADNPEFAAILGSVAGFFYPFIVMTALCFIMSIICFKAYHPAVSVIRTIFMAVCLVLDAMALKVMKSFVLLNNFFNEGTTKDFDEYMDGFSISESEITMMLLPVIASVIFFVFLISSIVALVKGPRLKQAEKAEI